MALFVGRSRKAVTFYHRNARPSWVQSSENEYLGAGPVLVRDGKTETGIHPADSNGVEESLVDCPSLTFSPSSWAFLFEFWKAQGLTRHSLREYTKSALIGAYLSNPPDSRTDGSSHSPWTFFCSLIVSQPTHHHEGLKRPWPHKGRGEAMAMSSGLWLLARAAGWCVPGHILFGPSILKGRFLCVVLKVN